MTSYFVEFTDAVIQRLILLLKIEMILENRSLSRKQLEDPKTKKEKD